MSLRYSKRADLLESLLALTPRDDNGLNGIVIHVVLDESDNFVTD